MSRKPIHLEATARKPGKRQQIWQQIRAQSASFTVTSLADAAKVHRDTVKTYVQCLLAGGVIEQTGEQPVVPQPFRKVTTQFAHVVYKLVKDSGFEAPRYDRDGKPVTQGLGREQMWRTMKMLTSFTYRELAMTASTEEVPVSEVDAKDYCNYLSKAGYLAVMKPGKGGSGDKVATAIYRFVTSKNSGPKAPMIERMKIVFDPNLGKIVWHPEVEE
jgi:hypothetical protein